MAPRCRISPFMLILTFALLVRLRSHQEKGLMNEKERSALRVTCILPSHSLPPSPPPPLSPVRVKNAPKDTNERPPPGSPSRFSLRSSAFPSFPSIP